MFLKIGPVRPGKNKYAARTKTTGIYMCMPVSKRACACPPVPKWHVRRAMYNLNSFTTFFCRCQCFITSTITSHRLVDGAEIRARSGICSSSVRLSSHPANQPSRYFIPSSVVFFPVFPLNFNLYWSLIPHARRRDKQAVRIANFLIVSCKNVYILSI